MASGGKNAKNAKISVSEPKQRSSWRRTTSTSDKDDNVSLNSFTNDLRPNNLDFSDWRPSSNKDQLKRRKKGNPEWEREQSLTQEFPTPSERQHGTPRSFARTKISPSTPTSQRVALENLRQHMTFSDQEDALSIEGDRERINERNLLHRQENIHPDVADGQLSRPVSNRRDDHKNRNNNKQNHGSRLTTSGSTADGKPDSSQIIGKLMQLRDYIKQATSMMGSLRKSGDPSGYQDEMECLQKSLDYLEEQERGCIGLLQTLLSVNGDESGINDMCRDLTTNLKPPEDNGSMDLDMNSEVSEREERSVNTSTRPLIEDRLGLTSDNDDQDVEEDEPSESSDNSSSMDDTMLTTDRNQEWNIELGESELAMGGVQNPKEAAETLIALRQQKELLQKLIDQQEQMRALKGRQATLLALQKDAEAKLTTAKQKSNEACSVSIGLNEAASSMSDRMDRSISLERSTDPELMDIRQELQYLRNELNTKNPNLEHVQSPHRPSNVAANRPDVRSKNQSTSRPLSPKLSDRLQRESSQVQAQPYKLQTQGQQLVREVPPTQMTREQLHFKLQELLGKKHKLDQLLQDEFSMPLLRDSTEQMNKDQLQDKLLELQAKKRRMDEMLQELQSLRTNPSLLLNNATSAQGTSGVTSVQATGDVPCTSTEGTDHLFNGAGNDVERQKLQKLNEVKDCLSQLKSLVHIYESTEMPSSEGRAAECEGQPSLQPPYSDYVVSQEVSRDNRPEREQQASRKTRRLNVPVRPQAQQEFEGNNISNTSSEPSNSESESHLSSLGPWGDDPEIQEKVKKLKAAKEKLKHLQNLVAVVQQSPGVTDELPDNLAELAASIEDVESQLTQAEERNNIYVNPNEQTQLERNSYYQTEMDSQLQELEQLKEEKTQLLSIQTQLQSLHDRYQQTEAVRQKENQSPVSDPNPEVSRSTQQNNQQEVQHQQTSGPSVTFSSNEEVYNTMRNQRMMREELREKKKQLESIMKKDSNKKQYYRNQDNHSDTISYNTEMFGAAASVDQTMATWGGSTVDNLENVTEDGANNGQDNEEEDEDAFPSDGILQVEEEEEQNQSDNETYIIEEDVRQRKRASTMTKSRSGAESKGKHSFPRPSARQGNRRTRAAGSKDAWTKPTDFNKWSRNRQKSRQENYRSAEDIIDENEVVSNESSKLEELKSKVDELSQLCQSLLVEQHLTRQSASQSTIGYDGHSQMSDLQQQLQQQQMIMSLNQCHQQISLQHLDMQNMQRQLQALLYQLSDNSDLKTAFSATDRVCSMPSLLSPLYPRQSCNLLMSRDTFALNPVYTNLTPASNRPHNAMDTENSYRSNNLGEISERQSRSTQVAKSDSYQQKSVQESASPRQLDAPVIRSKKKAVQTVEDIDEEYKEIRFSPDRQRFEEYLARKKKEFLERNKLPDRSQSQLQEQGQRKGSQSKSCGIHPDNPLYRPGLSAGISGAGYLEDGRSIISSIQSSHATVTQANEVEDRQGSRYSDRDNTEMSLFETLRETIYSEVATLISQNENRPHYLIELFRELQLLTTDYLRQRVLYDIKDVVSKYLVEDTSVSAPPPPWMSTVVNRFTTSEMTPSESIVTSDDDVVKTKLKQKVAAMTAKENQNAGQMLCSGSMKNEEYDYQEQAGMTSSMSTPSNSYWDSPFNQDPLGETAIHLDKTLEKMREYEKKLAEKNEAKITKRREGNETGEVSSSAMDQGDESSVNSDSIPYPRIDTQQLDQHIKSIMTEVIPVIKEHMDNMCSPQLLAYVKRLVLSLTQQYDNGQEFTRFFHRQLGSILQDTLVKYEGRKMRECGEDLLVDMSEVLFNELAFFRLMQDLDDPLIAEKMKAAQDLTSELEEENIDKESEDESDTTESSANSVSDHQNDVGPTKTEEEELGKSWDDDDFANETERKYMEEDKDYDPESPYKGFQVELAQSETKPYTRIGSDEDDESATDESQSNEDPSETAVSIDARRISYPDEDDSTAKEDDTNIEVADVKLWQTNNTIPQIQVKDSDQGTSSRKMETVATEHVNGNILNGDIEVITMDEVPAYLNVMSSDELQVKVLQGQHNISGATTIDGHQEVTVNSQSFHEPGKLDG